MLVSLERGGRITDALERISHSLQETQRIERKLEVDTASGKKVVYILTGFPLFFLGISYFMNPAGTATVFHSLLGQLILLRGHRALLFQFPLESKDSGDRGVVGRDLHCTIADDVTDIAYSTTRVSIERLPAGARSLSALAVGICSAGRSWRSSRIRAICWATRIRSSGSGARSFGPATSIYRWFEPLVDEIAAILARRQRTSTGRLAAQPDRQPREASLAAGGIPGHQMAGSDRWRAACCFLMLWFGGWGKAAVVLGVAVTVIYGVFDAEVGPRSREAAARRAFASGCRSPWT